MILILATEKTYEILLYYLFYSYAYRYFQLQTNSHETRTQTTCVANKSTTVSTSSSSSTSTSTSSQRERKVNTVKSDLDELKNNMNEMKNIPNFNGLKKLKSSLENLVDADDGDITQPLVTYPDDTPTSSELSSPTNTMDTVKFEQKTTNNYKATKVSNEIANKKFACSV